MSIRRWMCAAAASVSLCVMSHSASADIVSFSANFDAEMSRVAGTGSNVSGFTVTGGSVDVLNNGNFGLTCFNGSAGCLDLDGGTATGGTLQTDLFAPGTYTLSFALGGSQRGDTNTVNVSLGTFFESFTLAGSAAFQTFIRTAVVDSSSALVFANLGGDNVGSLLDDVTVSASVITNPVPGPIAGAGLPALIALGGFVWARRRKAAAAA